MDIQLFTKILKEKSFYDYKKMKYKYAEDFSDFLDTLKDLYYKELPLCDFDGKKIGDIPMSTFYGKCSVVTINGIFTGEDMENILPYCKKRVIFKGNGEGFLLSSAAQVIADSKIKLVGIDNVSIALPYEEYKTHRILALSDVTVIENLNLKGIKDGHDYTICALPIRLDDLEAAPCRVILLEQEKGF